MWYIVGAPLLGLALLITGIYMIKKRRGNSWHLWVGIGLITLFILSLPITILPVFGFLMIILSSMGLG